MSTSKNKYWNSIIIGLAGMVLAVSLPESYYIKYIVNLSSDTPTVDANGKFFYIILRFLSEYIGKLGLQIIFGLIALICFYIAYGQYKHQKKNQQDWTDYQNSRIR